LSGESFGQRTAGLVLLLIAVASYGNFYVYDSIGPVADLLQRQRGLSDTQIGLLNAIYSLPNVVLVLVGGILTDRYGASRVTVWTASICLVGAVLTAFSPGFPGMAAGRLLFGIGAETFLISTTVAIADYFATANLAFAMGLTLAVGRAGSYSADMSPTWFADAYAGGWQPPLVIAALMAAISLIGSLAYRSIDRRREARARPAADTPPQRFVPGDLLRFGNAYWYLLALCVLWYAVMLAFRSTFSIKYFQHAHGLDLANAGAINSYVFLTAMFATPIFGWLSDRTGRYAAWLAFGAGLLPLALVIMTAGERSLWLASALIGVSYSLVPAVMWPFLSKLVPAARFGTALGLMWVVQNAGVAAANLVAGWLNDRSGASAANPAGYEAMMLFFGVASALGFAVAVLLWFVAGRGARDRDPALSTAPAPAALDD
jgi:MFS family permease